MINKSGFISQKFIKYFFDNEILNEGVAILIDCSRYINKNKKLFNMFLICWLTEGLNSIGMKYSVALISDENYKRIIKNMKLLNQNINYKKSMNFVCYLDLEQNLLKICILL